MLERAEMSDKRVSKNDLEKVFEDFFGETLPNESDTSSLLIIGATFLVAAVTVSYTHLTLPTIYSV